MRMQNDIAASVPNDMDATSQQNWEWRNNAHDIKNILASISLIADELIGSAPGRPQVLGSRLERGCARILEICANERIETPDQEPAQQTVSNVINDVVDLANSLASDAVRVTGMTLERPLEDHQATPLFRILANLTTNAVVAMDKDGGMVNISVRQNGDTLQFDVTDTGPGMFSGSKEKDIEPLRTGLPVRSGAGLSIAELMARRIKAHLELVSTSAKGTHFRLTLPCASQPAPKLNRQGSCGELQPIG